ncbi:MAG: hypothetical protein JWL62_2693 [Hyphomicrobiales bacterium]|jgi:hypothetical protein|nr:hypothetical protein [Hyphomicrobiales bacterium]
MRLNAYALGSTLIASCLAGTCAGAAEPREGVTPRPRPGPQAVIMGEDETAGYVIAKILENFKSHGYDKLGEWTMYNPVVVYQRPFLDISVVKLLRVVGDPDQEYRIFFRIDLNRVKAAEISRGVFHVTCISRCIDVWSNGQFAAHDYFWINAVTIPNNIDATRVNRAFRRLLQFYPIRYEPFDVTGAR